MNYQSLPLITIQGSVSEKNRQDYYARNSNHLTSDRLALLKEFQTDHFHISGTTQVLSDFIISSNARANLIYPIAFLILTEDASYYTDRSGLHAYELRYTLEGEGYLEYNGKSYILKKGDGFFIDCHKHHYYRTNSTYWKSTVLHFHGNPVSHLFKKYLEKGSVKFSDTSCPNFEMMQYEILKITQKLTPYAEYKLSCLFNILLTDLLVGSDSSPTYSGQPSVIEEIILFMKSSLSDFITIGQLTRQFGISSTHLTREFRKYTGSSPKEYLIQLRINEAKRLLKTTNNSIEAISSQVGFSDTAHFIQMFKKREGETPLKYRKLSPSDLT
ncbi:AraC family transcriptional regulator [Faecalicatena acetigenes]|jgi:AraC-like DNA-binding protein/mannose-6-phosphate isomerase-like protein (cupin superfamily)|uniref:AraC family transcriptional regulator n=1 Tax=Faecalicatena acetigenes TaxID=2981790 RepID=A0ABT2TA90_9FIRM|nr:MULTISPECIES: AraC family transcriptional regulator [Lachnospiraceae]MCU6747197.1 AraC family transcriptional regulator [Faecalicatena acetigenes]SCH70973.1 Bacillibactin transport regulator [uncultured Clostridium sp.]